MGTIYSAIDDSVRQFIEGQPIFFVGSAPLDPSGHINVLPKGLDTFRVLGPSTVAYLDLTGSGIETVSHLTKKWANRSYVLQFSRAAKNSASLRPWPRCRYGRCGIPFSRGAFPTA